jgi:hypothetical protein
MANTAAQFGFKHIGYLSGGAPDYQQSSYAIQKTNVTAIGFGDPVVAAATTGSPYIIQATNALATASPIIGIFVGCQYIAANGLVSWSPFWPGVTVTADATAYVIDAPNAKFLVAALQTAITSANFGQVANFSNGVFSTTGQGYSIATLDQSTATSAGGTASSSLPFKIIGPSPQVGNGSDPTTNFNWVVVTFNNQNFKSLVGV